MLYKQLEKEKDSSSKTEKMKLLDKVKHITDISELTGKVEPLNISSHFCSRGQVGDMDEEKQR